MPLCLMHPSPEEVHTVLASLPMYDLPGLRESTEAWWTVLLDELHQRRLVDEAIELNRQLDNYDLWRSPELLLSQTCGYPLKYQLSRDVQLVAVPEYDAPGCDGANYSSVVVVREDADVGDLSDLRGTRCAFNATHSQSGYNALRHLVAPLARDGKFFASASATGAHRASIMAVSDGQADVCAVDCVTWALLGDADTCTEGLRVVAWTASAPALPYVTHAHASAATVAALHDAVVAALARLTPDSRRALRLRDFAVLPLAAYQRIEHMQQSAIDAGYPSLC